LPELDPLSFGLSRVDSPKASFAKVPTLIKTTSIYRATADQERGVNPFDGLAMVVENLTTPTGSLNRTIAVAASANDYVTLSFMIRHMSANQAKTYVSVDVSGQSLGSRDYSFDDETLYLDQREWKVYTVTIKPQAAISTVTLRIWPFGVGAPAGLQFQLSGITAYTSDTVNSTAPWVNQAALNSVTANPSSGSWVVGDTFRNVSAAAGQGLFLFSSGGWVYG
jgi:hypothetical protein